MAELLIALVILGVIATFTIPKILQNQQDSKMKSIFKETVASLSDILNTGLLTGNLNDTNQATYFMDRLNAVKVCRNNAQTEGCWSGATDIGWNDATSAGVMLHNGALITDIDGSGGSQGDSLVIDYNGATGPNQNGKDQLVVTYALTSAGWFGVGMGKMAPRTDDPTAVAFYAQIFAP